MPVGCNFQARVAISAISGGSLRGRRSHRASRHVFRMLPMAPPHSHETCERGQARGSHLKSYLGIFPTATRNYSAAGGCVVGKWAEICV